jgi:hypothetical protein
MRTYLKISTHFESEYRYPDKLFISLEEKRLRILTSGKYSFPSSVQMVFPFRIPLMGEVTSWTFGLSKVG